MTPTAQFQKFHKAMNALCVPGVPLRFGVAVSGGIDSLSLFFLMDRWCKTQNATCMPLHIDHGLRPESAKDARTLTEWMAQKGYSLIVKKWAPTPKPTSKIQEQARQARYALLEAACRDNDLPYVVTAHHYDDDQETFHMRQEKNSANLGLAGISKVRPLGTCYLLRPLLDFTKKELRSIVGRHPHLEDPTNHQPLFHRNRVRLAHRQKVDLKPYKENRRRLEEKGAQFLATNLHLSPGGWANLPLDQIKNEPAILWALSRIIYMVGHQPYAPSIKDVQAILTKKIVTGSIAGACLHSAKGKLWITPDVRTQPMVRLLPGTHLVWNKFVVTTPTTIIMKPLGEKGWPQVKDHIKTDLPYGVLKTLPAFWAPQDKVISAPFLTPSSPHDKYEIVFSPSKSILAEIFV